MKFTPSFVAAIVLACTSMCAGQNTGFFRPWYTDGRTACVQPSSQVDGAPLVATTCNGSAEQTWLWIQDIGDKVYRLQNGAPPFLCAFIELPAIGTSVVYGECTLSDGSGNTVSNAEWRTSAGLPNTVTLRSHVLRADVVNCIALVDGRLVLEPCSLSGETWIVGEI